MLGAGLVLIMWTWVRGTRSSARRPQEGRAADRPDRDAGARPPHRAPGTAIFLTSDPDVAPVALMHNLKHNKVLHEKNVILTVRTTDRPRVPDAERVEHRADLGRSSRSVNITYGFMETPNVPKALGPVPQAGLKFDIMSTSFFLAAARSALAAPGHAAVAGQAVHLPDAQRRQPHRLLPHPARPRGRAGHAGGGLKQGCDAWRGDPEVRVGARRGRAAQLRQRPAIGVSW